VGDCLSNHFLRSCRGCSLVVGRSGHMGEEGVYGVRIVSGVAFLSASLSYAINKRTFASSNHIVGIEARHLNVSKMHEKPSHSRDVPAAIPTPIPILAP
jgi:hypothetical protein